MFGLSNIINLATTFVFAKFPEATNNFKANCKDLFDVTEMVVEELQAKNGELFAKDYTKDFVNIKDLDFGDRNVFKVDWK